MGNTPLGIVPARGSTSKGSAIRVEPLETTDGDDSPSWRIIAVSVFNEQTQAPRITTGAHPTSHHASCCRPNRVSSKPGVVQTGDTPPRSSRAKTRRREENAVVFGTGTNRPETGRSWGQATRRPEQHLRQAHPGATGGAGAERGTHHFSDGERGHGERGHTTLQSRHPTPFCRSIPFNRHIPFNRYIPFYRHTSKPGTHHRVRLTRRREDAKGRRWGHTTRRPEQHLRQAHPGTTAGAGDTPLQRRGRPEPWTHHPVCLTRRRERKRSGLRHGGQIGRR